MKTSFTDTAIAKPDHTPVSAFPRDPDLDIPPPAAAKPDHAPTSDRPIIVAPVWQKPIIV